MRDKPDIGALAVSAWRLEKWSASNPSHRIVAVKSAVRGIMKFLRDSNVEIIDPIGSVFDPGLAIEVVGRETDSVDELIVTETITPYVYQSGALIQRARVVLGRATPLDSGQTLTNASEPSSLAQTVRCEPSASAKERIDSSNESKSDPSSKLTNIMESGITIDEEEIERMIAHAKIL